MNRISLMAAAVLTVVLAVAASAQAGPITVLNPGFEYFKSTTDNTDYNNMPDDWLPTRVGVSEPCGQITWDVHQTSGTKGMWANDMVPYHNGAYQVLGTDLLANTIYTLSVDVLGGPGQGMGLGYGDFPSGSVIGYQDLPLATASTPGAGTALTTWTPWTETFDTTGISQAALSQPLRVELYTMGIGSAQMYWDNVQLTSSTAPEPCTLMLLAIGLIGLLAYAWRKRR